MVTLPAVGLMRPTSMRIVVVLPAPFGPRKPKISPRWSSNETLSTMVLLPMILVRLVAVRVGWVVMWLGVGVGCGSGESDVGVMLAFLRPPTPHSLPPTTCYRSFAMRRFLVWYLPI